MLRKTIPPELAQANPPVDVGMLAVAVAKHKSSRCMPIVRICADAKGVKLTGRTYTVSTIKAMEKPIPDVLACSVSETGIGGGGAQADGTQAEPLLSKTFPESAAVVLGKHACIQRPEAPFQKYIPLGPKLSELLYTSSPATLGTPGVNCIVSEVKTTLGNAKPVFPVEETLSAFKSNMAEG